MVKTWYVGILWYFTNLNWGHLGMISLINHEWGRSEVIVCHPDGIWAWSSHSHPTATAFGNQRVLGWRGDDLNPCGQNLGCSINGAIPKDYFMICHGKSQGIITGGTPMLGNTPRLKKLRNRSLSDSFGTSAVPSPARSQIHQHHVGEFVQSAQCLCLVPEIT